MPDNSNNNNEEFFEKQKQIYKTSYVTLALVLINVVVFALSNTILQLLYSIGMMYTPGVLENGEYHRLITAMFLHQDINHLFNNMMMLLLVGAIVEHYLGHIAYIIMYMVAGIFGNLLSMAYEVKNNLNWVSLGASGAVMGIVGFLVVWLFINRKTLVKDKSMLIRLFFLMLFVIESCFFQAGANTVAHLGGFLAGFVFGIINIILFNNRKDMEGIA
ncbi:rhomboid family intramembrane serine protease [Butyrivibrio sp. VCB2006]|uniref:rhomboid family intramembrane serine protease n=1 Tax=Butyrivibrio sp. VCB2006 TaxID=1280679 RepID=UPI00041E5CF8|nr:rhomboid family intramembrane serine protease [Butyrivibrio sp. VCB2006]